MNNPLKVLAAAVIVVLAGVSCGATTAERGTQVPLSPEALRVLGEPLPVLPATTDAQRVAQKRQVSPEQASAREDALLKVLNEFRQQGTVGGKPAVTGTCAEGKGLIGQLPELVRIPALDVAARLHAQYMGQVEASGFFQEAKDAALYLGRDPLERAQRALQTLGGNVQIGAFQINLGKATAEAAVLNWLSQPKQCATIIAPFSAIGIGFDAGDPNGTGFDLTGKRAVKRDAWMINWGAVSPMMAQMP